MNVGVGHGGIKKCLPMRSGERKDKLIFLIYDQRYSEAYEHSMKEIICGVAEIYRVRHRSVALLAVLVARRRRRAGRTSPRRRAELSRRRRDSSSHAVGNILPLAEVYFSLDSSHLMLCLFRVRRQMAWGSFQSPALCTLHYRDKIHRRAISVSIIVAR